jgi:uncharacterized protein (DUF885 family)
MSAMQDNISQLGKMTVISTAEANLQAHEIEKMMEDISTLDNDMPDLDDPQNLDITNKKFQEFMDSILCHKVLLGEEVF